MSEAASPPPRPAAALSAARGASRGGRRGPRHRNRNRHRPSTAASAPALPHPDLPRPNASPQPNSQRTARGRPRNPRSYTPDRAPSAATTSNPKQLSLPSPTPQSLSASTSTSTSVLPAASESSPLPSPSSPSTPTELAARLTDEMRRGAHECLVCLDRIRRTSQIWSCHVCHAITHLHCARRWARAETPACPSCRTPLRHHPQFRCYCSRRRHPVLDPALTPGSCGETCLRPRGASGTDCTHRCPDVCHPGPCVPCLAVGPPVACFCGAEKVPSRCGIPSRPHSCGRICGAVRSCGHPCDAICHDGDCPECTHAVDVRCHCQRTTESLPCGVPSFSCGAVCDKPLECGKHRCTRVCHEGACSPCVTSPAQVKYCPCGKRRLTVAELLSRTSCTDPVPTCGAPCGRALNCLVAHPCLKLCGHESDCGPCAETIRVACRCESSVVTVSCAEPLEVLRTQLRCQRKCNQRLACRKHHCQTVCCPYRKRRGTPHGVYSIPSGVFPDSASQDHPHECNRICEKPLCCGLHQCDLSCGHSGECPPCGILVREPLPCACGATIQQPPVRCGSNPPQCSRPCSRPRPCAHPCPLECHPGDCPPCVEIVRFECIGGHGEARFSPCHLGRLGIRCHRACARPLACGVHACRQMCHASGDCEPSAADGCGQKCGLPRKRCGHACAQPCHPGLLCPEIPCRELISVTCPCGRRRKNAMCLRCGQGAHQASAEVVVQTKENAVRLSCDDECTAQARLRAFASAVGRNGTSEGDGVNTDQLGTPITKYPEFLTKFAETEPSMLSYFEQQFAQIVLGKVRKAVFPYLPQLHRLVLDSLVENYMLNCETERKANKKEIVVRHRGAGIKPVFPRPLLSEAFVAYEREKKRERQLEAGRELLIHVASSVRHPASMQLEARVERELRAHSGAYRLLGKANLSSNLTGVRVEFSTAERGALALSSLRGRPGVTVENAVSHEAEKHEELEEPSPTLTTRESDVAWNEGTSLEPRLYAVQNALPARGPPEVVEDESVPDSWDD